MDDTSAHTSSSANPPPDPDPGPDPGPDPQGQPPPRRLVRGPDGMIGGVSTGIGNYLGIDPVIIRLLFVLFSFFAFAGVIAYLILWIVLPDARDEQGQPPPPPAPRFRPLDRFNAQPAWAQATMIVAFALLVIGMFNWPDGRFVWPVALLIIGLLLLSDRGIPPASQPPPAAPQTPQEAARTRRP